MVPEVGIEPTRGYPQGILSPQRLPFRHSGSGHVHHNWNSDFGFRISDFSTQPTGSFESETPATHHEGCLEHILFSGFPEFWYIGIMDTVKLGKKGQISIPKAVLDALGLGGEMLLLVEATPDGAILLRPAGVYPIEIYSDTRVGEFLAEDEMSAEEAERVRGAVEG